MNATNTDDPGDFDLAAYLRRIDYAGPVEPTLPVLRAVHLAHATHIPFENLDILLKRPIRLDLESLQAKLVAGGRGGYCFEQNLLFATALRAVGFSVQSLIARVRFRVRQVLPRTHMLLLITLAGERWLADAGFGADGLMLPVPLESGQTSHQFAWWVRALERDRMWVMQSAREGIWEDLYAFTLEPQLPVDYEVANHYTSTHPDSRFTQLLVAQRVTPQVKIRLRNRELTHDTGRLVMSRSLAGDDEILQVLDETFGLAFASGTRFAFIEPGAA
jgi:N-hydroxyarylamine O-acetyltransferase